MPRWGRQGDLAEQLQGEEDRDGEEAEPDAHLTCQRGALAGSNRRRRTGSTSRHSNS
jgi:hypothetical protein